MISHQMMPCCSLTSNITLHYHSYVVVYKYDASILLWCNLTVISSALVIVSEITVLESYTVHLPTIYSIIVWSFKLLVVCFFGWRSMSPMWALCMTYQKKSVMVCKASVINWPEGCISCCYIYIYILYIYIYIYMNVFPSISLETP